MRSVAPADRPEAVAAGAPEAGAAAAAVDAAFRLRAGALAAVLGALALTAVVAVAVGPAGLGVWAVLVELVDRLPGVRLDSGLTDTEAVILWQWRLPRIALAALVGGTLSMSGAAYQGVFRNPLADPYLLGVAAGAGLGATIAIVSGATVTTGLSLVPVAAFGGALAAVAMAYGLGRKATGSGAGLVLAGVAVASFLTSLQTFVLQRNADTLREVYLWILGRVATSGWDEVLLLLPYTLVGAAVCLGARRQLDVLRLGDEEAAALGARPGRVRLAVVVAATLATGAAVAVSGLIGFVGIIVPHAVRLVAGTSYRTVLPLSFVGGAAFLVVADLIARTVVSPAELPIGVVTALVGAPFFAVVLRRGREEAR